MTIAPAGALVRPSQLRDFTADQLIENERPDAVLLNLDEAIKKDPKDGKLYTLRATIYNRLNEYDRAKHDADKAVELSPSNAEAHGQRALTLLALGELRASMKEANLYLKLASEAELPEAFDLRGFICLVAKKYSFAIVDFNTAISMSPKSPYFYVNRADAFTGFGVYERALKDCNKALDLLRNADTPMEWSTRASAYGARSRMYQKMNNQDLARQDKQEELHILRDRLGL
jgi:tetratricopeptide (TPR) repeat protein